MKEVPQDLFDYLHSRSHYFMCDLFEIRMDGGLVLRYAEYDADITLPDGRFFSSKGPGFKRTRTKLSAGVTVDNMTVRVMSDAGDQIDGVPIMHICANGGFDCAELSLYRCFMDQPGAVIGAVEMFTGEIDVDESGGLEMNWKVKSAVQRLNVSYPPRNYYPGCPYSLYDKGCGLRLADFAKTGIVIAADSCQTIRIDVPFAGNYYDQGGVEFTSGVLAGVAAPIRASANGTITLLLPLPTAPSPGDKLLISPGCDKDPVTCAAKFKNWGRNRATPYIPLPEAIL